VSYLRDEKTIKQLGKRIQKIRKQKGVSQAELAADCNIEISQVSRIERGIINTSVSQVSFIAKSLKVPLRELFDF